MNLVINEDWKTGIMTTQIGCICGQTHEISGTSRTDLERNVKAQRKDCEAALARIKKEVVV